MWRTLSACRVPTLRDAYFPVATGLNRSKESHVFGGWLGRLGVGFDSRTYRLEELRDVPLFDVDHPSTQKAKRQRLQARLESLPGNVRFVPVDFEKDDLETALLHAGFDRDISSVALWEGVVSYLTPAAVDQNFRILARILAQRSQVIFSYVHQGALDGSVAFREARRWKSQVRSSGEPFIFGFDPAGLTDYLLPRGFALVSDVSTVEAAKSYGGQPYNESYV